MRGRDDVRGRKRVDDGDGSGGTGNRWRQKLSRERERERERAKIWGKIPKKVRGKLKILRGWGKKN